MSWVLLSLRKSELKRTHADYVAEDLQISREERQLARRKMYNQTCVRNDQQQELSDSKTTYNDLCDSINADIKELKNQVNQQNDEAGSKDGDKERISYDDYTDASGHSLSEYQQMLDDAKEQYQSEINDVNTYWEDELAMIEEEANDEETVLEQEKVEVETQMEAVSQELSSVSEAVSSEIQNSTIKLS